MHSEGEHGAFFFSTPLKATKNKYKRFIRNDKKRCQLCDKVLVLASLCACVTFAIGVLEVNM